MLPSPLSMQKVLKTLSSKKCYEMSLVKSGKIFYHVYGYILSRSCLI